MSKVVASYAEGCRSIYNVQEELGGISHENGVGGNGQSIDTTVYDGIVRS